MPKLDEMVVGARRQSGAVGREGQEAHDARVAVQAREFLKCVAAPQRYRAVEDLVANPTAKTAPSGIPQATHSFILHTRLEKVARVNVPELDHHFRTTGGQQFAIGVEGHQKQVGLP